MKQYQSTNADNPQSSPELPQVPADSKTRVLERVPVKLNRNFLNFPLARDTRAQAKWAQSKTGGWMADLPGEGRGTHRIQLIMRAKPNKEFARCPSALDMNVLFQLLAEAQRPDAITRIEFASLSDLLRRLGLKSGTESARVSYRALRTGASSRYGGNTGTKIGITCGEHYRRPFKMLTVSEIASLSRYTQIGTSLLGPRVITSRCPYRYRRRPQCKTLLC